MPKKGNILIVEDDASARESLREILKLDYDVFLAENGAQAVKVLQTVAIDTVTLEPWLAGLQGRELLKHIREACPSARVIIVSGHRLSVWFDDMVREEVFDYLPKPFDQRDLVRSVARSLLRRSETARPVLQLTRGA